MVYNHIVNVMSIDVIIVQHVYRLCVRVSGQLSLASLRGR